MRSYRRAGVAGAVAVVALLSFTSAVPSPKDTRSGGSAAGEAPFTVTDAGSTAGSDAAEPGPAAEPGAVPTTPGGQAGPTGALQGVKLDVKPLPAPQAIRELRTTSGVTLDPGGRVRSVSAPVGKTLQRVDGAPAGTDAAVQATAFLSRYGAAFGLRGGQQARRTGLGSLPGGDRVVRFQQYDKGLPVIGGDLVVTVNRTGDVVEATAETAVSKPTATTAAVSKAVASVTAVKAAADKLKLTDLVVKDAGLWLYDGALIGAPTSTGLRPTWRIELAERNHAGHAATVLVDATDGTVTLVIGEYKAARDRLVCDLANNPNSNLDNPAEYNCSDSAGGPAVARREGGAATGVADVNKAYDHLGVTYDFYRNNFGRDSLDGRGKALRATVRACDYRYVCPFPNAFWDGDQMVFGAGYANADDVVGHELTHGVIDSGPGLLYAYQSGAINEALADIMGELVDQANVPDPASTAWLIGEDLPGGALRDMENPALYAQPDWVGSPLWEPDPTFADNGGVHTNSGVANKAAYLLGQTGTVSFRSTSVTGIGLAKSAQLWYRVLLTLTSGATYFDLGQALSNGCRRLVGYRGITTGDCAQVDKAATATGMTSRSTLDGIAPDSAPCPTAGQSTTSVYSDGFEGGAAKWVTSGPYWQAIPSTDVPYSYARTGRASLNGWTTSANAGNGVTVAMRDPVTVPAGAYLRFSHAMFKSHVPGSTRVLLQYNEGAGWLAFPVAAEAGPTQPLITEYQGYVSSRYNLSTLAGKAVTFRFVLQGVTGQWIDFYLDDFSVYRCLTVVGAPTSFSAALAPDGTSAQLDWAAPTYAGPGVAGYEVTVQPGSLSATVPAGTTGYAVTGLDPTKRYRASVRVIGADGEPGEGVTLALTHNPNIDCATASWVLDPATGRRVPPWPCPGARPR